MRLLAGNRLISTHVNRPVRVALWVADLQSSLHVASVGMKIREGVVRIVRTSCVRAEILVAGCRYEEVACTSGPVARSFANDSRCRGSSSNGTAAITERLGLSFE